jgi:hypothetical protein
LLSAGLYYEEKEKKSLNLILNRESFLETDSMELGMLKVNQSKRCRVVQD